MWQLVPTEEFGRRLRRHVKKHPREAKFTLDNLDTFKRTLDAGTHSQQIRLTYVHPEPGGVLAITERGAGKNAIPLRLYVYPDNESRILHLLTLGDKASQHEDILSCKAWVKANRTEGEHDHGDREEGT